MPCTHRPIAMAAMGILSVAVAGQVSAEVVWNWSDADTGAERGIFTTTGDLVDGSALAGSYQIIDFVLEATTTSLPTTGSYAGGQWSAGNQSPVGFTWDGTGPTEFWRAGGTHDNGLNLYAHPLPSDPDVSDRIGMSIDFFVIDRYSGNQELLQEATINLSTATASVPLPVAAWIALPILSVLGLIHYARQKNRTRGAIGPAEPSTTP